MAEWSKAHAWSACVPLRAPWVRIPVPPPDIKWNFFKSSQRVKYNQERRKVLTGAFLFSCGLNYASPHMGLELPNYSLIAQNCGTLIFRD